MRNVNWKGNPDQRMISEIHRSNPVTKSKCTVLNNEAMDLASQKLKFAAYKVWEFLCQYACLEDNGDPYAFFPIDIVEKKGYKSGTYTKAFGELIENGYLIPDGPNTYIFYEIPLKK